jgi:type IV secretory pathway VirB6-like protein
MTIQQKIENLLKPLPHRMKIIFAVYCCNDVKKLIPEKALPALELTEKWLIDPNSVSSSQLQDAANAASAASAAYRAAYYASSAADAAAYRAANAASAASAAYRAANAASAAADAAAYYAANAASAASTAANAYAAGRKKKLNEYKNYLISMINDLSELERVLWGLEET